MHIEHFLVQQLGAHFVVAVLLHTFIFKTDERII